VKNKNDPSYTKPTARRGKQHSAVWENTMEILSTSHVLAIVLDPEVLLDSVAEYGPMYFAYRTKVRDLCFSPWLWWKKCLSHNTGKVVCPKLKRNLPFKIRKDLKHKHPLDVYRVDDFWSCFFIPIYIINGKECVKSENACRFVPMERQVNFEGMFYCLVEDMNGRYEDYWHEEVPEDWNE